MYWIGLIISIAGSQMQLWACTGICARYRITPMVISGIGLARFLPWCCSPWWPGLLRTGSIVAKLAILTRLRWAGCKWCLGLATAWGMCQYGFDLGLVILPVGGCGV